MDKVKIIAVLFWFLLLLGIVIYAFGAGEDAFHAELDSDIDRINALQIDVLQRLAALTRQVEDAKALRDKLDHENRVRALEYEMEKINELRRTISWGLMFIGLAGVPVGVAWYQRRKHPHTGG